MSDMKQFEIKDFSNGLVTNVRNEQMQSNEFPILKNWDYGTRRAVSRRLGFEDIKPVAIPAGAVQGLFQFEAKPYRAKSIFKMFDFGNQGNPLETDTVQKSKIIAVDGELFLFEKTNMTTGSQYVVVESEEFIPEDFGWSAVVNGDVIITNEATGNLFITIDVGLD